MSWCDTYVPWSQNRSPIGPGLRLPVERPVPVSANAPDQSGCAAADAAQVDRDSSRDTQNPSDLLIEHKRRAF